MAGQVLAAASGASCGVKAPSKYLMHEVEHVTQIGYNSPISQTKGSLLLQPSQ